MRVRGNVSPEVLSIEPYHPKPGYVEARVRENINELIVSSSEDEREETLYEYDEYTFLLPDRENLREEMTANLSDWLITGRTLEVNESASIVQDMKQALEIMGVNE